MTNTSRSRPPTAVIRTVGTLPVTSFADGIPDVAQARRLGHRIPDKIQHIYSHVAPEIETRLQTALQHRWETALTTLHPTTTNDTTTAHPLTLPALANSPTLPAA
jgi:hypothetical protein